jgi:hypothetical protein
VIGRVVGKAHMPSGCSYMMRVVCKDWYVGYAATLMVRFITTHMAMNRTIIVRTAVRLSDDGLFY